MGQLRFFRGTYPLRLTGVRLPKGQRPIPARHVLAIEAATGVSRHVLRPDVFGSSTGAAAALCAAMPAGSSQVQVTALIDSRMSKRAVRAKLRLSNDAHLAKVLDLPVEQVEGWAEEDIVPALPQVM